MLSVNRDQANGFDQSLALIGAEVIKQCLYCLVLFGDFTFSCHYEGSGQCVVTGLNIFFRCVYAIELQSFYGIIYNIERNITDRTGGGSNLCHNGTGGIQFVCVNAGICDVQQLFKSTSCTGACLTTNNNDRLIVSAKARLAGVSAGDVVRELLANVPNPDRAAL